LLGLPAPEPSLVVDLERLLELFDPREVASSIRAMSLFAPKKSGFRRDICIGVDMLLVL